MSQGVSYAKWGRWVDAFSSCLTLKGLHLFVALNSAMPVEFPEDEDEGESEDEESKDVVKPSTELLNVLALQYKVANKYEFSAKSAEAYALLPLPLPLPLGRCGPAGHLGAESPSRRTAGSASARQTSPSCTH